MTDKLENKSISDVAKMMADSQPGSIQDQKAKSEFYRRQSMTIKDTSEHTKKYTTYMLVSVVIIALSFLATLAFDYLNYTDNEKYMYINKTGYVLRLDKETGALCHITNAPYEMVRDLKEHLGLNACLFN